MRQRHMNIHTYIIYNTTAQIYFMHWVANSGVSAMYRVEFRPHYTRLDMRERQCQLRSIINHYCKPAFMYCFNYTTLISIELRYQLSRLVILM